MKLLNRIWGINLDDEETYEDGTFYNTNFESLVLGSGILEIFYGVFTEIDSIEGTLSIPNSVTYIDPQAFYGCTGFTGLQLSTNLQYIEYGTFENCNAMVGPLSIPDSVTL